MKPVEHENLSNSIRVIGGLRTRNETKKVNAAGPLVSIVTVVFNGEREIENTMLSVINQTYQNIEYIIIDGGSLDGTVAIIKKYDKVIDFWSSEKDFGIYHAMNKGIDLASGRWINFMNCGDSFFSLDTVELIFSKPLCDEVQIIYGDHEVVYSSGRRKIVKAGSSVNLWKGSQFCHQSSFSKLDYHKSNKFNLRNEIVADFEYFYLAFKKNVRFKYVDTVLASFSAGGISDIKRFKSIRGWMSIVEKNHVVFFYYNCLLLREFLVKLVKVFLGRN